MLHAFPVNFRASVRDAFGDLFWKPFGSFGLHFLKLVRSNSHQIVSNNRCGNWHRTKIDSEDVRVRKGFRSWWPGGGRGEVNEERRNEGK